jgi:hypothetical protein
MKRARIAAAALKVVTVPIAQTDPERGAAGPCRCFSHYHNPRAINPETAA